MLIKNLINEIPIPGMSIRKPKIRNGLRKIGDSDRKLEVAVNILPNVAPRSGPDTGVPIVNLDSAIIDQNIFYLGNRGPKRRFSGGIASKPETSGRKIFGFENLRKERVLTSSNIPSSMKNKIAVDRKQISDTETPILLSHAYIVPGSEMERRRRIVFLDTSPPKIPDNGSDFGGEGFGK